MTLRLPPAMIAAARISARNHDTTLSGLLRDLVTEQLMRDGIDWTTLSEPIPGQTTLDDVTNA